MVVVLKPAGMLVHASPIARDAEEFLLQTLRNQLGKKVYPCHRLDRKTSGIMLFALSPETHATLRNKWEQKEVKKEYLAIVRGWTTENMLIDYPLTNEKGKIQEAQTQLILLKTYEIPIAHGSFSTSRFSLVRLIPETGRFHQLRKHMKHIFHPIIGDRPHGCNKQNRLLLKHFGLNDMCLLASKLKFEHPISKKEMELSVEPFDEFERILLEFTSLNLK